MHRSILRPVSSSFRAVVGCSGAARRAKGRGWYYRAIARQEEEAKAEAVPAFPEPPLHGRPRQRAFLDLALGDEETGRLEIELADDVVPKTVQNFLALCDGSSEHCYKGTQVNKVWRDFMVLAGDFDGDLRGGHSSFGTKFFDDENFVGRHSERGVLSMASGGVDQNSSIFFIACKPLPHLDGRNVPFGKVVGGDALLKKVEETYCQSGVPVNKVVITDCGLLD